MAEHAFDVVVIGAGPAGEVAAGRLGQRGQRVAVVESRLVGGECAFYACMPSKALLRPAQALAEARRVPGAREAVTGALDAEAALGRRDEVIHHLSDDVQLPWLDERGVTLFRGHGRLEGERRVRVDTDGEGATLTAERGVVVATGSSPVIPPIPGLREARPWTNRQATTAGRAPKSLIVLGGGVAGAELAQAWASLGSHVALVEQLPQLLAREEPFAGEQVAEALREQGAEVRLGVKAIGARRDAAGVSLTLEDGDTLTAEELLVAVGRSPDTADIGLETLGLDADGPLEVDDSMRVPGHDWLYAVGDVNGRVLLTHMGKYQGRLAADAILGGDVRVRSDGAASPRVVFTEPQVAAVGLTLAGAREQGLPVRAVDFPTSNTAGASYHGRNAPGLSRLVVNEERGVLIGATFTGVDVAEWLHAATIAIVAEVSLDALWHSVPAFPTRSEVWLRLLETYGL